jgi:hypothetical protein
MNLSIASYLNRSSAIKCPSVAYHLAGSKKVQQALAGAGVLEEYASFRFALRCISRLRLVC